MKKNVGKNSWKIWLKKKDLQRKQEEEKWKKMVEMESWKRQQKLQDDEEMWNKEIELQRQKQQQKLKEEEEKWIKKEEGKKNRVMFQVTVSGIPAKAGYLEENNQLGW